MAVYRVYARCNGGHYFIGGTCPFDGWSSPETEAIARAAELAAASTSELSLQALIAAGLSPKAAERATVVQYSSAGTALDAIEPSGVVIAGQYYPLHKAPPSIK